MNILKYIFYILGFIVGIFCSIEQVAAAVALFMIGIMFHMFDMEDKLNTKLNEMERNLKTDHAYLKKDIKVLDIKK